MSGIIPDSISGSVVITDALNNSVNNPPQTGLFTSVGTSFVIEGGLSYLQIPDANGSCGGRVTPMQVNFIESELLALAQAFNPSYQWIPNKGNNLETAFSDVPIGTESGGGYGRATAVDAFGNTIYFN